MLKTGKYRALRNIPVGFVLQAVHSTDVTEKYTRIIIEFILLSFVLFYYNFTNYFILDLFFSFILVHTFLWLFIGNFWVYILDSFAFIRNPGIDSVLKFVNLAKKFALIRIHVMSIDIWQYVQGAVSYSK